MDKELIAYVADIFGIKAVGEYTLLDITEELGGIRDFAAYRKFIRERIGDESVRYLTGFQKFLELTRRYKEAEFEAFKSQVLTKTTKWIDDLCEKVKQIAKIVMENQDIDYGMLRDKYTREPYFTPKETKALKSVGSSLYYCVMLQRSVSGRDMLAESLQSNAENNIRQKYLPMPKRENSKALEMAKSAVKRIA